MDAQNIDGHMGLTPDNGGGLLAAQPLLEADPWQRRGEGAKRELSEVERTVGGVLVVAVLLFFAWIAYSMLKQ
ncbi:hypothetical protein GQ53DRAFT_750833 [Thozetella sp. PMI_491]|nr:hypothetical protein GQ53DRAFT_750833 [Thozetella sp. PMI_491]